MLASSFKAKIQRLLLKGKFKKSEKTKGRIVDNVSAGFTFVKYEDDEYYLHFKCGNLAYRGMSVDNMDKKTEEYYDFLVSEGLGGNLEWREIKAQKALLLLVPKQ